MVQEVGCRLESSPLDQSGSAYFADLFFPHRSMYRMLAIASLACMSPRYQACVPTSGLKDLAQDHETCHENLVPSSSTSKC